MVAIQNWLELDYTFIIYVEIRTNRGISKKVIYLYLIIINHILF